MDLTLIDVPNAKASANVEQSKAHGDYYRDLANNYYEYSEGIRSWPYRPLTLRSVEPGEEY